MDANEIERFLRNYQQIRSARGGLNETDTRNMIINPFLMAIGWNFVPNEIESEYQLRMGSGTNRVDYCLKLDGSPAAFFEVKPLGTALTTDEISQVLSYGRVAFVRWCILSNGSEVIVLDSQARNTTPKDSEVFRFNLAQLKDAQSYLEALTPGGIRANRLETLADEIAARKNVLGRFDTARATLKATISSALGPFSLTPSAIEELSDGFLTRVRSQLAGSSEPPQTLPTPSPGPNPILSVQTAAATRFQTMQRAKIPPIGKGVVALFPSNQDGLPFLTKYNAWGFVRMTAKPDYCAIYITKPEQKVRFIAPVQGTVKASEWLDQLKDGTTASSFTMYDPNKFVVRFSGTGLVELEDPIPWQAGDPILQGLRFVTLDSFRRAKSVRDLEQA